jgi:CheY-like chemotaxis protein
MVVEDEPDIYEVLMAMFGIWGIDGVAFVDGEEAMAWIEDVDNGRFQGELPELALLDIRLPGEIQGPQVGERLRKSPHLNQVAIVFATAYKLTPDEEKAIMAQAGADRLIYKPLPKFADLQKLLEDTITARRILSTTTTTTPPSTEPKAP